MILSAQSIRKRCWQGMINPFNERIESVWGLSYGLGPASYDVRVDQDAELWPNENTLLSTLETVNIPTDLIVHVRDKSTWARRGLSFKNTHIDPGFRGHITLEVVNHTTRPVKIIRCMPIVQLVFELLDEPTEQPYKGKYQNQPAEPVKAIDKLDYEL